MSKVFEGQQVEPAEKSEGEGWILDEGGSKSAWVLGEEEQPAPAEAPAPAPVVAPAPGTQPGQGYQYTTETGHTFRGDTPEAVLKQMEQAVTRAAQLAANSQGEIERARRAVADQTQFDRGGQRKPEQPVIEPFDAQAYYKLLADAKPKEALEYQMRTLYGIDNFEEFVHQARTSYSQTQANADKSEVADFMQANQDFPYGPQTAEMLLRRVNAENAPITRWNLEVAKNRLYSEGVIVPVAASASPQMTGVVQQPQSRGAGAPPIPRNVGGDTGERELSTAELEALPIEQHRAYLRKRGHNV